MVGYHDLAKHPTEWYFYSEIYMKMEYHKKSIKDITYTTDMILPGIILDLNGMGEIFKAHFLKKCHFAWFQTTINRSHFLPFLMKIFFWNSGQYVGCDSCTKQRPGLGPIFTRTLTRIYESRKRKQKQNKKMHSNKYTEVLHYI